MDVKTRQRIAKFKQIADVWYDEQPDWVEGGCADVSLALWQIAKKLKWPCLLVTGCATVKSDEFNHVWLQMSGVRFDPVAYACGYRVKRYSPMRGNQAEQLKIVTEFYGASTEEDHDYSDETIEKFQLS